MSLTATYDPVLSRIRLSLTGGTSPATFERSTDGVQWTTVRGGSSVVLTAGAGHVDDYEFEPGVLLTYRASGFTTTITQDLTEVWLKVPAAPFLNRPVTVVDHSDVTRRSRSGLFDVVGRTMPVMVGDVASSLAYTLELLTDTPAEERDLDYLLASGEVVFVQLPSTVEHMPGGYFAVGDASRTPTLRISPRRVWSLPLTEVAAPGADVVGSTYTWTSTIAEYATWTDVIAGNLTWADLLERVGSPSDVIVA